MAVMTDTSRVEELKRRVQRDPASISFAALAEEYRRLGMFAEAIETCRAGLLRHPSYISARVTLGRALVEIGEFDAASVELEQVLRSAPENLAAIRALADIHRRRGEIPETIDQYDASYDPANLAPPPPASPPPASVPVRIAVQSADVEVAPVPPALIELEAFLAAIARARRDVPIQAAR
jgi:tetratricopeptide (TPR) repeat protein